MIQRIIGSRNQREGRYAGRIRYFNISMGKMGRVRHIRTPTGFFNWNWNHG